MNRELDKVRMKINGRDEETKGKKCGPGIAYTT